MIKLPRYYLIFLVVAIVAAVVLFAVRALSGPSTTLSALPEQPRVHGIAAGTDGGRSRPTLGS